MTRMTKMGRSGGRSTRWLPRLLFCSALCGFLISGGVVFAAHDLQLSNNLSATFNDTSGPGRDQSWLNDGCYFLDVLSLTGRGDFNSYRYHFSLAGKATNDSRSDTQRYSLTNLQGRLTNRIHTLTAGDAFESFSQYSLSTAVKGASYRYSNEENHLPDVALVYGVAYARWDNFWGLDAVQRNVLGIRAAQHVTDDFTIAANYVQSRDHNRIAGSSLYDTDVVTIDWEYLPIPGLTVRGESAYGQSEESLDGVSGTLDKDGFAHHLEAIGDGGPSRVVLDYEYVSPDFVTLLGSATSDREKIKATWRYKATRTTTWHFSALWYHDNLDGDLAYRTDHYRPEIGVSKRQIFHRRYAEADASYKFDYASGGGIDAKNHYLNLGYRDRFGVLDTDTNVGLIYYDNETRREGAEYTYNTTLSSRHSTGPFVFKPSIRLGGWTLEDELADSNDQVWEYSCGLGVDIPSMKLISHFRVGQNKLITENGDDVDKMLASMHAYYRPDFLSMFNYAQLYLRGSINDFSYSTSSRDFAEKSLTAGINIRF